MTKRKRTTNTSLECSIITCRCRIPSLSNDIIFQILSWVRAIFSHTVARFVSKYWAKIISSFHFIQVQLSRSISNPIFLDNPNFHIDFKAKKFQVMHFQGMSTMGLLGCHNGLMLFRKDGYLYVANPVTRKVLKLPPSPLDLQFLLSGTISISCLSKEFKVICIYENSIVFSYYTLTIGNNMSWRKIDANISLKGTMFLLFSVGDIVVFWSRWWVEEKSFLALDLNDESVHLITGPPMDIDEILGQLMPMGTHLYVVATTKTEPPNFVYKIRLWRLRDFRRSDWVEVFRAEMNEKIGSILCGEQVEFMVWMENHKILIFMTPKGKMIAYNFKLSKKHPIRKCYRLWYHTNSFVSW